MRVYLTDSLDGRLSSIPMPAAITLRQVSVDQVRKTVDRGACGLFQDQEMAASVMKALNRRISHAHHQTHITQGDQLLLAQQVGPSDGGQREWRLMFYEVRIAR